MEKIQQMMARALEAHDIKADFTFCRRDMVSVAVEDATQFADAKRILSFVPGLKFDSETSDDECGHFAYYTF